MNYTANIFCELIESVQGITFLRQEEKEGLFFRFYQGYRGLVMIDFDDDNFTDSTGQGYLRQLGLEHLTLSMYPPEPTPVIELPTPVIEKGTGSANECSICNGGGQLKIGEDLIPCKECNGTGTRIAS